MPITIPEFVQFQGVLYPLRGLWNTPPSEGDKFVNCEIDWGTPGLLGVSCVQFQLSGNSPVAFSQIVAISVDNSRCGSNVDFIFPDSGFVLTVPAFNQGVYPVFTNALMFYVNAPLAALGDITIAQILNSQPPPVAIQPSSEQEGIGVTGVALDANSDTALTTVNGTLNGFSVSYQSEGSGTANVALTDGPGGPVLWYGIVTAPSSGTFQLSGLHIRFTNGVYLAVTTSTITAGTVTANIYYTVP